MKRSQTARLVLASCMVWGSSVCGCSGISQRSDLSGVAAAALEPHCPLQSSLLPLGDSDYGRNLLQRIGNEVFYPAEAMQAGQTGDVLLCLQINRGGTIEFASVVQSSGYPVLDGTALYAVGMVASSEPREMPPDFHPGSDSLWFALPINFQPPGAKEKPSRFSQANRPCAVTSTDYLARRVLEADAGSDSGSSEGSGPAKTAKSSAPRPIHLDSTFLFHLKLALGRHMHFPVEAWRLSDQGAASICIAIDAKSRVIDAMIEKSSGYALLDGAALMGVGLADLKSEIPPLPPNVKSSLQSCGCHWLLFSFPVTWKME